MSIEWLRDLAICILGFGATAVIILIGVLALLLYRKLRPILDSLKATTKTMRDISSCVEEEVARPLIQVASFVQGIRQAVGMVSRFSKKKGDKENV
ncbi:hypothetical protein ACFLUO_07635 [Chloroflexota bacterium]